MKKLSVPSKIIAWFLAISIVFISIGFAFTSTASAWGRTPGCTGTNFAGGPVDNDLIAGNGDVVTTNKWNALVCHVVVALGLIYGDTNTDRKQSVFDFHTNSANSLGSSVSAVRLPTIVAGSSDPTVGGVIAFYDPVGSYSPTTARSAIASIEDSGGRGGLALASLTPNSTTHIFTIVDPVRDAGASPNSLYGLNLRRHAIAWEKVSTSDTNSFDTKCQYRIVAGPGEGWVLYMNAVVGGLLRGQFNGEADATHNYDVSIVVRPTTKNNYQVYDQNGLVPASVGTYGNGTVTHLEKLCLPVYNH